MAGIPVGTPIPKETIPDPDRLYRWVPHEFTDKGKPNPGAFGHVDEDMSVDWSKYCSPEDTRKQSLRPAETGVVQMVAGEVRQVDALQVEHAPEVSHPEHSLVLGITTPSIRRSLRKIATWAIAPPQDS